MKEIKQVRNRLQTHRVKAGRAVFSDRVVLFVTFAALLFSLIMIYSTTGVLSADKFHDPYYFLKRQALAAALGMLLLVLASFVKIDWLKRYWALYFVLSGILLALIHVPGIGVSAGGARRWISLAGFSFQPVEFVKLFMVIFMAGLLAKCERRLGEFKFGVFLPMFFIGILGVFLLMQPDFGSLMVMLSVSLGMLLAAGVRLKFFALCGLLAAAGAGTLIAVSPYRLSRVLSFLFPWKDASGKGYQLIQSLVAVGSGGLSGSGLGASNQKLYYLPAAHTDFIFAVIAEELGFLGCLTVLSLFLLLLWRGIVVAGRLAEDTFAYSLCVGISLLLVVPALLNIGVVLGLLPTKGMVLPLFSYGGTNLVVTLLSIGIFFALAHRAQKQMA